MLEHVREARLHEVLSRVPSEPIDNKVVVEGFCGRVPVGVSGRLMIKKKGWRSAVLQVDFGEGEIGDPDEVVAADHGHQNPESMPKSIILLCVASQAPLQV